MRRPDENWQAQPKEELYRRIHLLCQLLAEIGPDGKERRARLLIELADATERVGDYPASMTAAREAIRIATTMKDQALRAHAQGRLAGVLSKIGAIDEALALHTEQVEIYETLGDVFSRAVTLGDIARLKAGRGEVAEALHLHEERLAVFEALGDRDGQANARWSVAMLRLGEVKPNGGGDRQVALADLVFAYSTLDELGQADGIAVVGLDLAQIRAWEGAVDEARALAERARVVRAPGTTALPSPSSGVFGWLASKGRFKRRIREEPYRPVNPRYSSIYSSAGPLQPKSRVMAWRWVACQRSGLR